MRINLSGRIINRITNIISSNQHTYSPVLINRLKNQKTIIAPTYINYGR
jgi:hypothetical protein